MTVATKQKVLDRAWFLAGIAFISLCLNIGQIIEIFGNDRGSTEVRLKMVERQVETTAAKVDKHIVDSIATEAKIDRILEGQKEISRKLLNK